MNTDFDALSLAARNVANRNALHELWKTALQLESWFFIAVDHSEDAPPVVGISDGKPHLLGFRTRSVPPSSARFARTNEASRPPPSCQ